MKGRGGKLQLCPSAHHRCSGSRGHEAIKVLFYRLETHLPLIQRYYCTDIPIRPNDDNPTVLETPLGMQTTHTLISKCDLKVSTASLAVVAVQHAFEGAQVLDLFDLDIESLGFHDEEKVEKGVCFACESVC